MQYLPIWIFSGFVLVAGVVCEADSIPHGVQLNLSPAGFANIASHIPDILSENGINLSQGSLSGFDLTDHAILDIQVSSSQVSYAGTLANIALSVDTEGSAAAPGEIPFALSADVQGLALTAAQATVGLSAFPSVALDLTNVSVKTDSSSVPLSVSAPISVGLASDGSFTASVGGLQSNIDSLTLDPATFDLGLELPVPVLGEVAVGELKTSLPSVLNRMLQSFASQWADQDLPGFLQTQLNAVLSKIGNYEKGSITGLAVPGSSKAPINWSVTPTALATSSTGELSVVLATDLEDPAQSSQAAVDPSLGASSAPSGQSLEGQTYDAAVTIDEGVLNRLILMSFNQGSLSKYTISGLGRTLTLTQSPVAVIDGTLPANQIKLHFSGNLSTHWYEDIVIFDSHIAIQADATASAQVNADGTLKFVIQKFDPTTLQADHLQSQIQSDIGNYNSTLASSPLVLADEIAFPKTLLGVPMSPKQILTDPSGYLVVLLGF